MMDSFKKLEVVIIAKTELTIQLERDIWSATNKQGVFGCFEVTIGWFGDERVDFITYDTKGIWRCYEIKVSKSDFKSKAKKTFLGHFNYYVMTNDLYETVKEDIPKHIGVYVGKHCVKKAKKQELGVDEKILKDSLIRSLCREYTKHYRSGNPAIVESLNRQINNAKQEAQRYRNKYLELNRIGIEKFGPRWYREISR